MSLCTQLMKSAVPEGEELMPSRDISTNPVCTGANKPNRDISVNTVFTEANKPVAMDDSQGILHITWVKKLSRNRGKVLHKASEVDNSLELGDASLKRKLLWDVAIVNLQLSIGCGHDCIFQFSYFGVHKKLQTFCLRIIFCWLILYGQIKFE